MKVLRLGQSLNTISNGIIRNKNFEFTVNTATAGSTTSTQFQLPFVGSGAISMDVDWGDGTTDTITTYNQAETLHTYSASGIYNIKISNEVRGWKFNGAGDKDKITNVSNVGEFNFTENYTFYNCSNMTWTAIDAPTISFNFLGHVFRGCTNFNGAIGNWDVSSVLSFSHMLSDTSFDQNISSWNIRGATNISSIMQNVTLSTANYDALLLGWEGQTGVEEVIEGTFPNDYTPAYGSGVWQNSVDGNTSWTISGGKASKTSEAGNAGLRQYYIFEAGKSYNLSFTISNRTQGSITVYRGQGTESFGNSTSNEVVSRNITASGGDGGNNNASMLLINGQSGFDGSISNVTIKQIPLIGLTPNFGNSKYTLGSAAETARDSLTAAAPDGFGWTITDGGGVVGDNAFTFSVDTSISGSTTSTQFQLPLIDSGTIDMYVDWGDGSAIDNITAYNQAETLHTYSTSGVYTIKIGQEVKGWQFKNEGDKLKITNVSNCGGLYITHSQSFYGCSNMTWTAIDSPTITASSLQGTFRECTLFNGYVNNWDVSSVISILTFFYHCSSFNQPLDLWDTSSVNSMHFVFEGCTLFNQPLNNWNTSSANNMDSMLMDCIAFNQDLNSWDTSNVTNMKRMFRESTVFNGDITSWNVGNVINMGSMFYQASSFNQNIGSWDVSNVTNLQSTFNESSFNHPLNNWNTSSVTNAISVFRNSPFDQDISSWNIRSVTDMSNIMTASTLSTANYNALLVGWEGQTGVEEITNGDFATNLSGWILGNTDSTNTIVWDNGKVVMTGDGSTALNLTQGVALSPVFVVGKTYKVEFDAYDIEGEGFKMSSQDSSGVSLITNIDADGHYTKYHTAVGTTLTIYRKTNGQASSGKFDNISVKQVAAEGLTPNFGNSKYPSDLSSGGVARAKLVASTPTGFGWTVTDGGTV